MECRLSDTQYVRALGKIFEAGGQPVKNMEMRSWQIQLVPNLGHSVTQSAAGERCGGARTDGRWGGIDT